MTVQFAPDQQESIDKVRDSMMAGNRSVLLQGATGCHASGTKIFMWDGANKTVENIVVGDLIMGPDGNSRSVIQLIRGRESMYKITPKTGGLSFIVNENHVLSLKRTKKTNAKTDNKFGTVVNVTVKDWLTWTKTAKHIHKLWRTPINYKFNNDSQTKLIDPYILGVWLGDGNSGANAVTTMDPEIFDAWNEYGETLQCRMVANQKPNNKACTWFMRGKKNGINPFMNRIKKLKIYNNKRIPHSYMVSDYNCRINVLAGLIDTDGHASGSAAYEIIQVRKLLAEDISKLARSLGFCVSEAVKIVNNKPYYRMHITGPVYKIPVKIERKKLLKNNPNKNHLVSGFDVDLIGDGDFYGFTLSGDNLYLTADFTVHHNSGKSYIASGLIQRALSKNRRCAFVVPRRELVRQMAKTFNDFDMGYSYVAAGKVFNPYTSLHICTSGTLVNRLDAINPHLVFIDETHVGATVLDTIINHYKATGAHIVGLSATPEKLSGKGLRCWYDDMVCGPSVRWLIDNGRLCDYRAFAPYTPDLSQISVNNGDYAKGELSEFMEQDRVLIGNAVKHYADHAAGKLNIAYCVSRKHSNIVAQSFRDAGISAMHIDGETSDEERKRIIRAFAKREITVLCNVDLLTYGFDLSSQVGMDITVESMSDLRPTKSLALQMQKFGRVLRKKPFPALIFDHAGNIRVHGLPCEDRKWTLEDRAKKKSGDGERSLPMRQCEQPGCFHCHAPAPVCPNCGHVYPIQYREIEEVDGELAEIEKIAAKKQARMEVGMAKTLVDLKNIADERGYKPAWVFQMARVKGIKG